MIENPLFVKAPSDLYYANLVCDKAVVVNPGGTSSGKSYAIIQVLCTLAAANPGYRITVCTDTIPNLKKDCMRIMAEVVNMNPNVGRFIGGFNSTDRVYTFINGAFIEFTSYETVEDAKGGKRDILYINECTRVSYEIFKELYLRTNVRTYLDFNPTCRFWVHEQVLGSDEFKSVKVIRSWHHHNPYLTPEQHDKIESIKDPELWKVYARGLLGKLTGQVFDWKQVSDFPTTGISEIIWGIDWGYTTDPTAITRVACMNDGSFVVDLVFYAPMSSIKKDEFGDDKIPVVEYMMYLMGQAGWNDHPVYADHDRELIVKFRQRGMIVLAAEKGTGAELNRILYCKQKEIRYTSRSKQLGEELGKYRFVELDGKHTNKTTKGNDHAIDSATMAIYTHRNRALVK